jgi:uncharacterized membrane protein YbhN (UPF0104 family)
MSAIPPFLATTCGVFFALSLALYLATAAKRHRLDAALSARAHRLNKPLLAEPERMATYDQEYLIKFIENARAEEIAPGRTVLDYYARTILAWDMWFAVAFAAFIVTADLLAAHALGSRPWAARAFLIFACMGALYGVADLAEDFMLRKIFRQAEEIKVQQKGRLATAVETDDAAAPADAAQTDAANALTRLKMVTITASVIGVAVFFFIFGPIDWIISKVVAAARRHVSG